MADKVMVDYRRMDQRRYIYQPYWISSAEIVGLDLGSDETKVAIVFSFPKAQYGSSIILIEKVCFQVTEAFAGGTITTALGTYTLLTDAVTTGGAATIVDADALIEETDITHGTIGHYFALTGPWITAKLLKTELTDCFITPLDAVVPAVGFYLTTDGTLTAGKGRVHLLISEVPLV